MPYFVRFLAALLPLAVWVGAGFLAWGWWQAGPLNPGWQLWTLLVILAWGLAGRLLILPVIAKPDRAGTAFTLSRNNGRFVTTTTIADEEDTLYLEDHGPKEALTIVLTHDWGLDSRIWDDARDQLADSFRVITWDLPGLGRSRTKDVSFHHFADSLRRVVLESGDDRVVLVGHGIGGMIIQTLLRDEPRFFREHVEAVVLLNTTDASSQYTMAASDLVRAVRGVLIEPALRAAIVLEPLAWLAAWQSYLSGTTHVLNRLACSPTVTRSQLEAITLLQTMNRPSSQAKGELAMLHWDPVEAAAQLPRPLLVIGGADDGVTIPIASERLARMAPHAQIVVHEGVNHMGPIDQPLTYWRNVRSFLARLTRSALPAPNPSERVESPRRPARSA
jgi:pimeloyl-ACP methyl ester carboxylesterase